MRQIWKELYFAGLPIVMIPTSILGMVHGIQSGFDTKDTTVSFCKTIVILV